jgi:hypothetical protein
MLHGLKENLEATYQQKIFRLRDEELQLMVKQLNGTQILFTLLAGIMADAMWTGYYMYHVREAIAAPGGPGMWLELLVAASMYLSIFLPLASVFGSTVLTLYAPRRALCGQPEEFNSTVDALQAEFAWIPRLLIACMVSAFGTIATWSWATLAIYDDEPPNNAAGAIVVTLMACALGYLCYMMFMFTFRKFYADEQDFVSAKWFADGGTYASAPASVPASAPAASAPASARSHGAHGGAAAVPTAGGSSRGGESSSAAAKRPVSAPRRVSEGATYRRLPSQLSSHGEEERGARGEGGSSRERAAAAAGAQAPSSEERREGARGAGSLGDARAAAANRAAGREEEGQERRAGALQALAMASTEAGRQRGTSLIGMTEEEQRALDDLRRSVTAKELL